MKFNNAWRYRRSFVSFPFAKALMRSRRNIISAHPNRPPIYGPFMADLDVAYRCNCKCRMCQRWQYPRSDELSLSEYQKLAEAFYGAGVHLVSIAGGEPLLRRDIVPIIKTFADYGMMVNLCTNEMLLNDHSNDLIKSGFQFLIICLIHGLHRQITRPLRILSVLYPVVSHI